MLNLDCTVTSRAIHLMLQSQKRNFMNKLLLLLLLYIILPLNIMAENISTLFERIVESDLYNSQIEAIETNIQNKKASLYNDGWTIGGGTAYPSFNNNNKGMEYQLSIGKNIMLHHSQLKKLLQHRNKYAKMLKNVKKNQLKALIFRLYGLYCITMESLQTKGKLAAIYDTLNIQLKKGVAFGEFSSNKAIMVNLAFQNLILQISQMESQLQIYEAKIKSFIPFNGQFKCENYKFNLKKLFAPESSVYFDLLQRQKLTALSTLNVASNKLQSVNVNMSYSRSLGIDGYTMNLSVPLSFDNTRYEAHKSSTMHNYSSLNYQIAFFKKRYKEQTKALKARLNIYKENFSKIDTSIKNDSYELIKQSNLRFHVGEESLLGILKATQTQLQIVNTILQFKLQRQIAISNYLYNYAINPQGVLQK